MSTTEIDALIKRLLPQVLADRELGDGRTFTQRHMGNLWALSCLHMGECFDEAVLAARVLQHLPPQVAIVRDTQAYQELPSTR